MTERETMIRAEGLRKRYGTVEVLRGVSIEVARGEVVSIVGASGAGKTTLLQIMVAHAARRGVRDDRRRRSLRVAGS